MSDQLSIDLTSEGAASQALAIPRGRNRASISVKQRGSYDADTAAGTGARTVYIAGLDAAGYEQNEVITLNGTTNVQTVGAGSEER